MVGLKYRGSRGKLKEATGRALAELQVFQGRAVVFLMNTQDTPMKAITSKIDALIKANLALHVARTSRGVIPYRAEVTARHEAEVSRCQAELTATLEATFYRSS